jgi:hypothetical protein
MITGEEPVNEERIIAACGLDCTACDLRLLPTDAAAADRVVGWFRKMGWLAAGEGLPQILERSMYCQGCRGDRSVHWSADCPILHCCVDERGHQFCSECDLFPCSRLTERAEQNTRYAQALDRLRAMT